MNSTNRLSFIALLLAGGLLGCEPTLTATEIDVAGENEPAYSSNDRAAQSKLTYRFPVGPMVWYNPCTGEDVELSGWLASSGYRDWVDPAGGFHGIETFVMHLEGVGLESGASYVGKTQFNWAFAGSAPPAALHIVNRILLVSRGSAENMAATFRLVIALDAQNNTRVEVVVEETKCSG